MKNYFKILLNLVGVNIVFWVLVFIFGIEKYYFFAGYISIVYLGVLYFSGLFESKKISNIDLFVKIIKASTMALFIIAAVAYIDWSFRLPRYMIVSLYLITIFVISSIQYLYRRNQFFTENCLVIGKGEGIVKNLGKEYNVLGFLDNTYEAPIDNKPWLGNLESIKYIIDQYNISCLIFADKENVLDIMLECSDIPNLKFKVIKDLYQYVLIDKLSDGILIDILIKPANIVYMILKRFIDIILSFLMLVILIPIIMIISMLIKYESSGPIFYKQERFAMYGKLFNIIKFRTMINDAECKTGPIIITHKTIDPRITKIGKILRSTHLDELPQLINILIGDMSFVGPRPERPVFSIELNIKIKEWNNRLYIKPGLTGFAQIACIGSLDAKSKIQKDLYYIRNMSLLLDLKIIIWTILKILRGK